MRGLFSILLLGLALSSCVPLPLNQGICKTSEGDINTYNVIGVWKKDPKTEKEALNYSNGNFRLLYIVQGGAEAVIEGDTFDSGIETYYNSSICEKVVSNGIETKVTKAGLYFHDDARKRIRTNSIDLENDETEPTERLVTYSFTGSCGTTRLHLKTGTTEDTYTFFAANPPPTSCSFGSN